MRAESQLPLAASETFFCLQVDPNDQNGPDLETKIEEVKLGIRRAEVSKQNACPFH
jgi:hypothetical protein